MQLTVLDEGDGPEGEVEDDSSAPDVGEEEESREASPARTAPSPATSTSSLAAQARTPSVENLAARKQQNRLSGSGLRAPAVGKGVFC